LVDLFELDSESSTDTQKLVHDKCNMLTEWKQILH